MSTYTQILFSTKNRDKVLIKKKREHLFSYSWGILKNNALLKEHGIQFDKNTCCELVQAIGL